MERTVNIVGNDPIFAITDFLENAICPKYCGCAEARVLAFVFGPTHERVELNKVASSE